MKRNRKMSDSITLSLLSLKFLTVRNEGLTGLLDGELPLVVLNSGGQDLSTEAGRLIPALGGVLSIKGWPVSGFPPDFDTTVGTILPLLLFIPAPIGLRWPAMVNLGGTELVLT